MVLLIASAMLCPHPSHFRRRYSTQAGSFSNDGFASEAAAHFRTYCLPLSWLEMIIKLEKPQVCPKRRSWRISRRQRWTLAMKFNERFWLMCMLDQIAYPLTHSEIGNLAMEPPKSPYGQCVDGGVSSVRFLGLEGLCRSIPSLDHGYGNNWLRNEAGISIIEQQYSFYFITNLPIISFVFEGTDNTEVPTWIWPLW